MPPAGSSSDRSPPRVLTQRELNRALLARQFLLEKTTLPIDAVADRIGGLQTQYAPSGYVGLWTRVECFRRDWDASLLVHARRAGILPEEHRSRVFSSKNPFSVGTVLVDGRVVAAWSLVGDRIVVDPFEAISPSHGREIERERQALEAFHA